jgi:endonuclease/exonuclease/phosphatase family metal-dependent hydrolase
VEGRAGVGVPAPGKGMPSTCLERGQTRPAGGGRMATSHVSVSAPRRAVALSVGAALAKPPCGILDVMRAMTWNVWGRFGQWQLREAAISETIASVRPDVLALQEAWATGDAVQADRLASRHGLHAAFARSHMPDDPAGEVQLGLAVLSRWPLTAATEIRLMTGDGASTVALMVNVSHPEGSLHFMTACLDWEVDRQEQRQHQAEELLQVLTSSELSGPMPVILAGDLNAPPDAVEIASLTSAMTDCWALARTDPGHTFASDNPYVPDGDWHTDSRIDYVLARPGRPQDSLQVESATLAGLPALGKTVPSDHYAVVVELSGRT